MILPPNPGSASLHSPQTYRPLIAKAHLNKHVHSNELTPYLSKTLLEKTGRERRDVFSKLLKTADHRYAQKKLDPTQTKSLVVHDAKRTPTRLGQTNRYGATPLMTALQQRAGRKEIV